MSRLPVRRSRMAPWISLEKPVNDDVLIDVLLNAIRIDEERNRSVTQQAEHGASGASHAA